MATFVNAASGQSTNSLATTFTAGNLAVFLYTFTAGVPTNVTDTQGNNWRQVIFTGPTIVFWTIAKATGAVTITMNGTGSNQGTACATYSGPDAVGISGALRVGLGVGQTAVSCGPLPIVSGVITGCGYLGQASAYVSTSGSTNRTAVDNLHRNFMGDNLAVTNTSYTETGNLTGAMTFGGDFLILSIGPAGGSRMMMGKGL